MKTRNFLAILAAFATAAWAGQDPQTVILDVKNMDCSLCPITVRKALEKVPGVASVKVDFATKTAEVKYDAAIVVPAVLERATADAGYPAFARARNQP